MSESARVAGPGVAESTARCTEAGPLKLCVDSALEEVLQREGKDKEGLERAGQRERRERETERWREVEEGGPIPKGW